MGCVGNDFSAGYSASNVSKLEMASDVIEGIDIKNMLELAFNKLDKSFFNQMPIVFFSN